MRNLDTPQQQQQTAAGHSIDRTFCATTPAYHRKELHIIALSK
jgi:hypothetical protein